MKDLKDKSKDKTEDKIKTGLIFENNKAGSFFHSLLFFTYKLPVLCCCMLNLKTILLI